MKNIKLKYAYLSYILAILLLISSLTTTSSFAGMYGLQSAIDIAIKKNSAIRNINSQIPRLDEQIKRARSVEYQMNDLYHNYRIYVQMYNDEDEPYAHIKNMSMEEMIEYRVKLYKLTSRLMRRGKFDRADDIEYEIKFINYAQMFGKEEPKLTRQQIYRKYVRAIEMTVDRTKKERDKILNKRDDIKAMTSLKITQLYLSILSLDEIILLEGQMINLRQRIATELDSFFSQGIVSKNIVWENQKQIQILNDSQKMHIAQRKLAVFNFNAMLANDIESKVFLNEKEALEQIDLDTSIDDFVKSAQSNNNLLKSYNMDLKYIDKNLKLYLDYNGSVYNTEYKDLTFEQDYLQQSIRNAQQNIEIDVKTKYRELMILKKEVEDAKLVFDIAEKQLKHGEIKQKNGIVKPTDIHALKLDRMNKYIAFKNAQRNLQKAKIMFNILIEFGIS